MRCLHDGRRLLLVGGVRVGVEEADCDRFDRLFGEMPFECVQHTIDFSEVNGLADCTVGLHPLCDFEAKVPGLVTSGP